MFLLNDIEKKIQLFLFLTFFGFLGHLQFQSPSQQLSPLFHQQKMAQITITSNIFMSPITKQKCPNHQKNDNIFEKLDNIFYNLDNIFEKHDQKGPI